MRKSVLAMAAVAAMGAAGAANAGWFTIAAASVTGGTLTTPAGTFASTQASGNFNLYAASSAAAAGAGSVSFSGGQRSVNTLTQGEADGIITALGISGNGTVAYFGFDTGGGAPAYFGIALIGNGIAMDIQMANAHLALNGVYTNNGGGNFSSGGTGDTYRNLDAVHTAGQNYVYIFAGISVGSVLGAGTVSDTAFDVEYLAYNGTSWNQVGFANGVSSSSLNTATYTVPVPAPVLLAGAGLIGVAALRRRTVKKG